MSAKQSLLKTNVCKIKQNIIFMLWLFQPLVTENLTCLQKVVGSVKKYIPSTPYAVKKKYDPSTSHAEKEGNFTSNNM